MKEFQSLQDALHYRMTESEDNYFVDTFWEEEAKLACEDLAETIRFVQEECSDEELVWLGEIFDDVIEKTHSKEFMRAIQVRTEKVLDADQKKELLGDIEIASYFMPDE